MRIRKISWAIVMVAIAGCWGGQSGRAAAQAPAPYNIILLTPDQLRADYMQTYDYPLPDTANVDAFARQGTVFTRAYSAGPWTTPSFGAILTGLFPTVHGMTLPPFQGCGANITHPMVEGGLPPVPAFLILSPHKPILPELLRALWRGDCGGQCELLVSLGCSTARLGPIQVLSGLSKSSRRGRSGPRRVHST